MLAGEVVVTPVFSTSSAGAGLDSSCCSCRSSMDSSSVLGSMPVVYLMNVAIARKQNLAGVVKANRMGSVCAQSVEKIDQDT